MLNDGSAVADPPDWTKIVPASMCCCCQVRSLPPAAMSLFDPRSKIASDALVLVELIDVERPAAAPRPGRAAAPAASRAPAPPAARAGIASASFSHLPS
jgi:hypothetical protein